MDSNPSSISEDEFLQLAKELGMDIEPPSSSSSSQEPITNEIVEALAPPPPPPPPQKAKVEQPSQSMPNVSVSQAQFTPLISRDDTVGQGNLEMILDVALKVTVELGRTSMTIRDILSLNSGSVVELDRLAGEPVDILINEKLIAKGEVVVVDENFGVRVTDIISPTKRIASLK